MLLSGAGTGAISAPALVIVSYVVGALLLVGALATVLLRNVTAAMGALVGTLLLAGILYLVLGGGLPLALVQVVISSAGVGGLTFYLLRRTGIGQAGLSPFNSQLVPATVVALAVMLMLGVVIVATTWPGAAAARAGASLTATLIDTYPVGLATLGVIVLSAAAGVALLLTGRVPERLRGAEPVSARPKRRRTRPDIPA